MTENTFDPETPPPPTTEQVARMERAVVGRIAAARHVRRVRRGRVWAGAGAAAAVLAIAALVGPAIAGSGMSASSTVEGAASDAVGGTATEADSAAESLDGRIVAASGAITLVVDDVTDANARIGDAVTALGGYVESATSGGDPTGSAAASSGAWLQLRVPADALDDLMTQIEALGETTSSSTTRSDVTDQAADLRAQVAASQASVARLTELLTQAASVTELIEVEDALAQRQAELESAQQQLDALESQVSMSALSVTLTARQSAPSAEPAGFLDGLETGWNGLVAVANGAVIGLGFLLPWLVLAALAAAAVQGVRRIARRRRRGRDDGPDIS